LPVLESQSALGGTILRILLDRRSVGYRSCRRGQGVNLRLNQIDQSEVVIEARISNVHIEEQLLVDD